MEEADNIFPGNSECEWVKDSAKVIHILRAIPGQMPGRVILSDFQTPDASDA